MRYYPFYIDMRDETILLFGGGKVGFRKAKDLLKSECKIIAVSKIFLEDFFQLESDRIQFHLCSVKDFFRDNEELFDDVHYAILALNDEEENEKLALELRKRKIQVLRVDKGEGSDFIMPSVLQRDEVSIAVSSGGKNPFFAKELKKEIEALLNGLDLQKMKLVEEIRAHLVKIPKRERGFELEKVMKELIGSGIKEVKQYLVDLKEKEC